MEYREEKYKCHEGVRSVKSIQPLNTKGTVSLRMINNETNFEQRMKIKKKTLVRFFALTLPLVSAIFVTTLPFQAANAQLTPAQQQALKSLVATGFTNHYPLKIGSQNFSLPL